MKNRPEGDNIASSRSANQLHEFSEQHHGSELHAKSAARWMTEAWRRPVHQNRRIENTALWYAMSLEERCRPGVADEPWRDLLQATNTPSTRYEIEAAVRCLPLMLPFTGDELDSLRTASGAQDIEFAQGTLISHSSLFSRWALWLWNVSTTSQRWTPNREAQAFAEGCERLAASIGAVLLEHEQQTP